MKCFCKVLIFTIAIATIVDIAKGKVKRNEKSHLPIEVFLNPSKGDEVNRKSIPGRIQSENKAIELKIRSDRNDEGKLDLVIAATKEVQATEESTDRYSPIYNAEHDATNTVKNKNMDENETSASKALKTSRQDASPFYQPSDFNDMLPFAAMRQVFDQPQSMILGRNHFSPLQNLRHLEENLQREVHPHVPRNTNEVPFGMILSQPLYSHVYHHGMEVHPRFHSDAHILGGVPYSLNQPSPYGSLPLIDSPQPVSMVHNVHNHRYPLVNNTPQRIPLPESSRPEYGSSGSQYPSQFQSHHPHQDKRELVLHRHPDYSIQPSLPSNSPERHLSSQHQDVPEYNRHSNTQYPSTGDRHYSVPGLRYTENVDHTHTHLLNPKSPLNMHSSTPQHQPQEVRTDDRNLYYTPIRENDQRLYTPVRENHQKHLDQSAEIKRPHEYSPLQRIPIVPQREYRTLNSINPNADHPLPKRLQHQVPPSSSRLRQVPTYEVVPPQSLPKYLQSPVYHNSHQTRHSLPDDTKLQQTHYTLPDNRNPTHQEAPKVAFQPGSLRPGVTMEDNLSALHRHSPHRNVHPVPSYQYHPLRHEDDMESKIDENSSRAEKQKRKYKVNDLEDNNMPYSKEMKKYRKASLKESDDDLESHSSHQYIIKIG